VAENLGFELLQAESERMKEQEDTNLVSLNLEKRRELKEADQKLVKERNKQLKQLAKSDDIIYSITLDNVDDEKLYLADADETGSVANKEAKEKLNIETEQEREQKAAAEGDPDSARAESRDAEEQVAETETTESDPAAKPAEGDMVTAEEEDNGMADDFTYSHFMKEEAINVLLDLINLRENKPKTAGIN
jgi:succinate dehydrogenase flavin-adding protein (antitoxin of CptAB toxin-antitoxin module)